MFRVRVLKPFDGHDTGDIVPVHSEDYPVLEKSEYVERLKVAGIRDPLPQLVAKPDWRAKKPRPGPDRRNQSG